MKNTLRCIVYLVIALAPLSVWASCTTTGYASLQSSYSYAILQATASTKPVLQSGATLSCNGTWFDVWHSQDLSWGSQPYGTETDLTLAHDGKFSNGFGYEALVSYFVLAQRGGVAEVAIEVNRPFKAGNTSITPYLRALHVVATKNEPWHQKEIALTGIRFAVPISAKLSLSADVGVNPDFTDKTYTRRLSFKLVRAFDHGWSVNAVAKFASGLQPAFGLGIARTF